MRSGSSVRGRDAVRDARVADLALGPHEALRHRRLGHEERPCDLGRGEPDKRAQRERDLCLARQRGMAAREDQPQAVVLDAAVARGRRRRSRRRTTSGGWITATSSSLAAPVVARRRRSSARLRAVVVSQAPGVRGMPSRGQRSSARAKASCAHSSARSQSPRHPDQGRDDATPLRAERGGDRGLDAAGRGGGHISQIGPHFDRARCRAGDLRRDLDRFVEILGLDQVEAADLLLGLRERTVGGDDLAVADLHGRGVAGRAQTLAALQDSPLGHLLAELHVAGELRLALGRAHGLVAGSRRCRSAVT